MSTPRRIWSACTSAIGWAPRAAASWSTSRLADACARAAAANRGREITFFEILTAVTFLLFSEHPADAAIIEVGLGGRFDATNVFAEPAVSVIMPISLDHEAYLGDRVELIAAEKAGIVKPGRPWSSAPRRPTRHRTCSIATAERLALPLSCSSARISSP